jgi:hypothetical protein
MGVKFKISSISYPSPNDILMGRGGGTNNHTGNLNYRKIIETYKPIYSKSPKSGKLKFSCEVVDLIRNLDPPGRFLKKDQETNLYFDIGEKAAREKTSQCLREGQVRKGNGERGRSSEGRVLRRLLFRCPQSASTP